MAKIQIQFHATPEEAMTLSAEWAQEYGLTVALETFHPEYRVVTVAGSAVSDASERLGRVDRISLSPSEPDIGAENAHDFMTRNAGCLVFSVGPLTDGGLRESALSAVTDDRPTMKMWRELLRRAKAKMRTGAWVRNPHTEARDRVDGHLYTERASDMALTGVKMLAAAGVVEYDFDVTGGPSPAPDAE